MINCHVFHPEHAPLEDLAALDFSGNKPALPPLTTEDVPSVIYVWEESDVVN